MDLILIQNAIISMFLVFSENLGNLTKTKVLKKKLTLHVTDTIFVKNVPLPTLIEERSIPPV